jgi:hypothetical protein
MGGSKYFIGIQLYFFFVESTDVFSKSTVRFHCNFAKVHALGASSEKRQEKGICWVCECLALD